MPVYQTSTARIQPETPRPVLRAASAPYPYRAHPAVYACAFTIVGMALLLLCYLGQCAMVVHHQFQICQLKTEKAALQDQIRDLQLEEQRLCAFETIERRAQILGMVYPDAPEVLCGEIRTADAELSRRLASLGGMP